MPESKLISTREIVFKNEDEKQLFIAQCKKLVPDSLVKSIKPEEFESAVYDLIVDILRAFESRNEKTYGKTDVTYLEPSWFLKWQLSVKLDFDFKSGNLLVKSDIDDEFEKTYFYAIYFNGFVEIK